MLNLPKVHKFLCIFINSAKSCKNGKTAKWKIILHISFSLFPLFPYSRKWLIKHTENRCLFYSIIHNGISDMAQKLLIKNSNHRLTQIGLFFVILFGVTACGNEPAIKHYGGTLRLGGLGGKPSIINPVLTRQTISKALLSLMFNSLVRVNKEMMLEPDLAESWEISADGLIYTFHLRKGVRFHDGIELTSEDVRFTYELVNDPETDSPWQSYYKIVKTLETPDRHTFRIILKEPNPSYFNLMALPIAPKHLLEQTGGKRLKEAEFNYRPIGTGPFRFKEWTEDNRVVLEANPDYYEGRPYLDRIIATGYDTFTQSWSGFMHGETDVAFFIPKDNFEIARRDPTFRTYSFPGPFTYGLEYNLKHPFLNNKKVRQALDYGINIRDINNKVEGGYGIPATGPFLPDSWNCNPEIKPSEYNPSLAMNLLREEGWRPNRNNILEKEGQEFRFIILVNSEIRNGQMLASLIYQDLYRLGIRIDLKPIDYKKVDGKEYRNIIKDAGAYLTLFQVIIDPIDFGSDWCSIYKNKVVKLWQYHEPEIDRLINLDISQNTTDIRQRKEIYHRIHGLMYEAQPVTFMYFMPHLAVINSKFRNTDGLFSLTMPFWTIKDWWIQSKESNEPVEFKESRTR